jgi:hypothetical protein
LSDSPPGIWWIGRPPVREWRSIVVGKPADLGGEVCRGAG